MPQPAIDVPVPAATPCQLTAKEISRLVVALDEYIDNNGDLLADAELARFEDLRYRLLGLPDSALQSYVEGRRHDAL